MNIEGPPRQNTNLSLEELGCFRASEFFLPIFIDKNFLSSTIVNSGLCSIQYYQQLWNETSTRQLQRVIQTADGEKKVYKANTRYRLAILREYRKELKVLGLLPPQHKDSGSETPSDDEICVIHRPAFQSHLNLLNQTIH